MTSSGLYATRSAASRRNPQGNEVSDGRVPDRVADGVDRQLGSADRRSASASAASAKARRSDARDLSARVSAARTVSAASVNRILVGNSRLKGIASTPSAKGSVSSSSTSKLTAANRHSSSSCVAGMRRRVMCDTSMRVIMENVLFCSGRRGCELPGGAFTSPGSANLSQDEAFFHFESATCGLVEQFQFGARHV